jgi:hypothetical protein
MTSDQKLHILEMRGIFVTTIAFSSDSRRFVAGGIMGKMRLWDLERIDKPIDLIADEGPTQFESVAFSDDGKVVYARSFKTMFEFVSNEKARVLSWDATTGQLLPDSPPPSDVFVKGDTNRHGDVIAWIDRDRIQLIDSKLTSQELTYRKQAFRADPFFHIRQAAVAEKQRDWFAAAFHLDHWLTIQPRNPEAHRRRGLVALECGDWDRAAWHFVAAAAVEGK